MNYRFSTTSLASGNDINLKYQDLAFKLNFPTRKAGTFSIWGLGLADRNKVDALERSEWETMGDRSSGYNKLDKLAGGLAHKYVLDEILISVLLYPLPIPKTVHWRTYIPMTLLLM